MDFQMGSRVFNDAAAVLEAFDAPVYVFSQINPDGLAFFVLWRNRIAEAYPGRDLDLKTLNGGFWPEDTNLLKDEVIDVANEEIYKFLEDYVGEWPLGGVVAIYGANGYPLLVGIEDFMND